MAKPQAIFEAAGYGRVSLLKEGDHWFFFEGESPTLTGLKTRILFLDSKATWEILDAAKAALRSQIADRDFDVVVQNSAGLAQDQDLAQLQARSNSKRKVNTVRGFLLIALRRIFHFDRVAEEGDPRFVDPSITLANGSEERALKSLSQWVLTAAGQPAGVLLAKAGVGKTTVFRELFSSLLKGANRFGYPLLIESPQWARIASIPDLELWDIWKEALDESYSVVMPREFFQTFVESGAIVPLFDGFDELCSRLSGQFLPTATLESLLELAAKGESNVLLSARNEFWETFVAPDIRGRIDTFQLLPFNNPQTDRYYEIAFPKDFSKRSRAKKILARLDQAVSKGGYTSPRKRITNVPAVVAMVADCADIEEGDESTVGRFGQYLEEGDPLVGLLKFLCQREQLRRMPEADPEKQLEWLTELAVDHDVQFTKETARDYAQVHLQLGSSENEMQKILAHALLSCSGETVAFRFDFVPDFLAASWAADLVNQNVKPLPPRLIKLLARYSSGGAPFVEYLAERLATTPKITLVRWLTSALSHASAEDSRGDAPSALLHVAIKTAEVLLPSAPKVEKTALLMELLDLSGGIRQLTVKGKITNQDLSGKQFQECIFRDAGFSNCRFDESTRFIRCRFEGKLEIQKAEGFERASFETCEFRGPARDVIQSILPPHQVAPIDRDQIVDAFRQLLDKFRKGPGFKSLKAYDLRRGALRYSRLLDPILDVLNKFQVTAPHMISGVGQDTGIHIVKERIGEVRQFLDNSFLVGNLKSAVEEVTSQFVKPA